MRALFNFFLKILSKVSGKEVYYTKNEHNALGKTAVKSSQGFWYVGNVLSPQDLAYGILNKGIVEPDGTELIKNILEYEMAKKSRIVFYDIGANTGYYGIMAAFLGGGRVKTYSFEPVIEFNKIEQETIKLNNLGQNCKIFNLAVDDSPGEAEIYLSGTGSTLNFDFLSDKQAEKRMVKKDSLDHFFTENALLDPDFIKIDVESLEWRVVKGATGIIKKSSPLIWYESAVTYKQAGFANKDFFVLKRFLEDLGYKVYLTEGKNIENFERDFSRDGVHMFLALPKQHCQDVLQFLKNNGYSEI